MLTLNFSIMNSLRNRVTLIGNLGSKPEIINFDTGKKLAKVSIATTDKYRNAKGETVEKTYWHRLNIWNGLADVAEKYTDKGSEIAIEGRVTYNVYKDKEGVERQSTEIEVNELLLLGKKRSS
jgi:single-strand DNA-binding protein